MGLGDIIGRKHEIDKIEAFRKATDTKKALALTMITTYGVKRGKYSNMVNSQVVLDDLFDALEYD